MPNNKERFLNDYKIIKDKIIYIKDKYILGYDSSNSLAFQFRYWKLKDFNISSNIIALDDDCFIGKHLNKSDFFYVQDRKVTPIIVNNKFIELDYAGVTKPENYVQRSGEMVIEKTPKPDNIVEQRDSVEILGAEKDALQLQPINQLFIAGVTKPENEVQRTGELVVEKTPRPENVEDQRDAIEIIGAEKDALQL